MPKAKSEGVKSYAKDRNEDFERFKSTFRGKANPEDDPSCELFMAEGRQTNAKDDKSDVDDARGNDMKKTIGNENGERVSRIRDMVMNGDDAQGLGSLFLRNIGN